MEKEILVSIICNTYNQVAYIADALESFVNQQTDFGFEILVHDDASTDGTSEIIRKYEKMYPLMIRAIIQSENQYSKGVDIIRKYQYPRVRGKFVAFCEGDDYWIDMNKLQSQVQILRAHPEVDMCAHGAYMVNAETKKKISSIIPYNEKIVSTEEVIKGGGGLFATNSLMWRVELFDNGYEFWHYLFIDYTLQISGSLKGGIYFIPKCMSAYRFAAKGSWSRFMMKNKEKRIQLDVKAVNMLSILNKETNERFSVAIEDRKNQVMLNTLCLQGRYREVKKEPYRKAYRELGWFQKVLINLHIYFPFIFKIKQAMFDRNI